MNPIQICNQALGWLGEGPINSFEDRSRTAELCAQNFEPLRDAVLEDRMWTFAQYRHTSVTTDAIGATVSCCTTECTDRTGCAGWPEWGDGWVHRVDPCFIQVFNVYCNVSNPAHLIEDNWRRESGYIIGSQDTLYFSGTRREDDSAKWPSMFSQALAARLASDMAIPITENRQLQVDMWGLYQDKLIAAAARDGQQGANEHITQTRLTSVRYSGGYS